jgi:hypothetical protein
MIKKCNIMTPKELKKKSTKELLIAFKEKARCIHSKRKSDAIYKELDTRLGTDYLYDLRLGTWHMENGEGDAEFNQKCDVLINKA